ncbi:cupin domain-containing protein [Thalassotalea sp. G2M2-11]|uniref:ribosomal protein uL16 3-hydroxylase n=1 Tax=Thalassotalea sp. G2M2-11 TaxID=2787627 RepID=UPI0019D2E01E|nr:cupin domain-containing protein [Thalassotalea sp. G2M2-11]
MYQLNDQVFSIDEFLRDYWQKKPVVIRQGFNNFNDPISADEIAGLACDEAVQSRLVYKQNDQWQAEFGPFEDYQHLGEENWSLIVQALDHWSEDAAQLIEPFRFIPHWRLDDLMVSFATPGGGVGPHIDLYDVFICQGSGSRRWRVGDRGDYHEFAAHPALLHVEPFEPMIDVELNTGDILYIPPGFPHDGVTLETSLSFSVGFRTNSGANLISGLADHLIDQDLATTLIEDPTRTASNHCGAIDASDYALIKRHMQAVFEDDTLMQRFIGSFLTEAKHELDIQPDNESYSTQELSQLLAEHDLVRLGGLRAFYFSETIEQGTCYINGEPCQFDPDISPIVQQMCDHVRLSKDTSALWRDNTLFIEFIKQQIARGYWYFAE